MAATKHKTRAIKVGSSFIHVLNGCEGSLCRCKKRSEKEMVEYIPHNFIRSVIFKITVSSDTFNKLE